MLVKLCLGSLEEKVVRGLSFFRRPCFLVHIVLGRSNMNSDTCNLYKTDIFKMLSDLNSFR